MGKARHGLEEEEFRERARKGELWKYRQRSMGPACTEWNEKVVGRVRSTIKCQN